MPRKPSHHLRSLPLALAATLSPEAKRDLADYRTGQQRRRLARDAGGWAADPNGVPPFLEAAEAEATRAADLWRSLKPRSTETEAIALGKRFGLDAGGTRAALNALRRAELLTHGPDGYTPQGPGNVPF
ncbi:hypothetical protein [Rubricoccus marinus]|uniref:Uncharacterized protein n=1 Tax=Rubricoccus marinus TaxID=716817 RepID=A0A259TXR0_9BACT|nr:hypothetical protein [Rubricoccus marinus]OZC02407.1 hypothetical protein BSZ36_05105 [Rubricoccus marinus]